jgi:YVTN family beta-propeller protein
MNHVLVRANPVLVILVANLLMGLSPVAGASDYLGPIDVVASPDHQRLYVVEADAQRIDVVDIAERDVLQSIPCPARPSGLAVSRDGKTLYVTCGGPDGHLCVIDVAAAHVAATISVGHTPTSPVLLADGKWLVVCNRFDNDVSVVDTKLRKQTARIKMVREPVAAAATPDGKLVFVANLLPNDPADGDEVAAEVTVVDTAKLTTSAIRLPNGSSSVHGVTVAPDGKYAYVVHVLSRYQLPTTQLERGWMNTNALSVIDVARRELVNTVLLDDIDRGAANPWAVAVTADGKSIVVSHAGTHELSVIDAGKLLVKLLAMPKTIAAAKAAGRYDTRGAYSSTVAADVPNDLAFLVDLRRRIALRGGGLPGASRSDMARLNGPRGFALVGTRAFVGVYFSDAIAIVDCQRQRGNAVDILPLGPTPKLTEQRRGEIYFHDADFCFQQWQSCSSCHPNARVDGLNWDLLNDGFGTPKNAKSMLLAHATPPAMSGGVRASAQEAVRAGIRHIQFAVRPEGDARAIDNYLKSLEPIPSPHLVDGRLSAAAERGRQIFFDSQVGCAHCHPAPLYTDLKLHDVNSKGRYDRRDEFDTPTLIEVWRTAPYMHDGHYTTLRQLLDEGHHGHFEGDVKGLTDAQKSDLIEFVLSL